MSDHSNSVKLGEIIQEFGLEILHPGANYASIPLTTLDVNRPGLPLTGFFEPVSYTHLDVYKRQPLRTGSAW